MPQTSYPKPMRVAIVGPESTGKSVLAEQLASHYNTVWVSEYSRKYLPKLERAYNYSDILIIARAQFLNEQGLLKEADRFLFCDTEFLVNMIWCMEKYGQCHQWIIDMQKKHPYDLYLLCKPDLPWEADPLREAPEEKERYRLFDIYLKVLQEQKLPYEVVEGIGKERLESAIRIIDGKF